MSKLAIILGVIGVVSSFALGFEEDFDSYSQGEAIISQNNWTENGYGDYFQANATISGTDPLFLGSHYADISNNGNALDPSVSGGATIAHTFSAVTSGTCVTEFDVSYNILGALNTCDIFVCDSNRQLDTLSLQAAGVSVGSSGLRVFDGMWWGSSYTITNGKWYHAWITVDMDNDTWQLQMAEYVGEEYGAPATVTYVDYTSNVHDTFSFRDSSVDDIGMVEFGVSKAVMEDSQGRGMYVDNVKVPEPTTMSLLGVAGLLAMRRRKR
jgi:hypothetical protein